MRFRKPLVIALAAASCATSTARADALVEPSIADAPRALGADAYVSGARAAERSGARSSSAGEPRRQGEAQPGPSRPVTPERRVRRSRAIGYPWRGRLVAGVQLPAESEHFFTWDWGRRTSPNAAWRRWGTDVLVEWVQRVIAGYRAENPGAPRVGVADLSRPKGGEFGADIAGGLGHASHQNGLDVDLLYPRKDRLERPPLRAAQVDRRLAQALVDAFVRAGAERAFVGRGVRLRGPRAVVSVIPHHDDHVHVRISKRALQLWAAPLGLR